MAAPRLAQTRPDARLLPELFEQLRETMARLALHGWAHGDLSPYNVLLHDERLVVIDWPQIVDIIGNPHGFEFLERDVREHVRLVRPTRSRRGRRRAARRPRRRSDLSVVILTRR